MPIRAKLTTADQVVERPTTGDQPGRVERSEEEKAKRRERVAKAKDALARSNGLKGEHVAPARAALKQYLQRLNEPRQPSDEAFDALLEAPFRAPERKKPRR